MGCPQEKHQPRELRHYREQLFEPGEVIKKKGKFIPQIQSFLPYYRDLINMQWKEGDKVHNMVDNEQQYTEKYRRTYDPLITAGNLLINAFDLKIPAESNIEGIDVLDKVFNSTIRSTVINGIHVLNHAYKPQIIDSLLIGATVLNGSGTFDRLSPKQISGTMQAAKGLLSGDEAEYMAGLNEFSEDNEFDSSDTYAMLQKEALQSEDIQDLIRKYGPLSVEAYKINTRLTYAATISDINEEHTVARNWGGETYNVQIDNSIIVGQRVLARAAGGEIHNSIIATSYEGVLTGALSMHVRNSYLITPSSVRYIEDDFVGKGSDAINWHGYPDFYKLFH